jgi:putative ABC transport system permease protein
VNALRSHGPSILVAALGSAFGVALLQITGTLAAVLRNDDTTGSSTLVELLLRMTAFTFIVIAVYVASVVTANTFATIIAGRVRSIALLRLLGSSARRERGRIAREGLLVGVVGSLAGGVVGTLVAIAVERVSVATGVIPDSGYAFADPVVLVPVAGVVLTTWAASWVGSRRVTTVTPLEALGRSEELSREETRGRTGRNRTALVLAVLGFALLGMSVVLGLVSPVAVLLGLLGGVLSFTGIVLGADVVMPPVLRLAGRLAGRSAPARLAAENAVRHPQRSSRATIGLVIGVTLVTMFAVAMASFADSLRAAAEGQPGDSAVGLDQLIGALTAVFSILVGFSGLIAAVGLVNNLSLSVLQRRRELGLLRALGFTVPQVRRMVLAESAQLTFSAVVLGLVLGAVYGWAGAQSLLGSASHGIVIPGMPWLVLALVVLAGAAITAIASWAPARTAVRVSPVEALAVD